MQRSKVQYVSALLALAIVYCPICSTVASDKPTAFPPADHQRRKDSQPSASGARSKGISEIMVTPAYETAGVIIATGADKVTLEIRSLPDGVFAQAHPFVRFDQGHMASSLFGLAPGKRYEIRVQGQLMKSFTTLAEALPVTPKTTIRLKPGDSIREAARKVVPGTLLLLAPGTYDDGMIQLLGCQATAQAPIIIRGDISKDELKKHISRRKLPCIDAAASSYGVLVDGSSHIIIENVRIQNAGGIGIRFSRSMWCTLRDCQLYDNGRYNVLISKGGKNQHHTLVEGNHIADLKHGPFEWNFRAPKDVTYYGIKRDNNPGWGTVIRGNLIEGVADAIASGGDEIQVASARPALDDIRSRWPNFEVDVYDNVIIDCRDDGIETDGISINCRFYRNYIGGTQSGVSIAPSTPGPFFFVRNIMEDFNEGAVKINTKAGRGVIRNAFFYHNSIVRRQKKNGKGALLNLWDGTPSQDIVFKNNLFLSAERCVTIQPKRTHKPHMDYNLWYSPNAVSFFWWKKPLWRSNFADGWVKELGCDPNGIWADPKIDKRMNLASDSPAIDRGISIPGINSAFSGKAPDIGAVEFKRGE